MKLALALLCAACPGYAQQSAPEAEEQALNSALAEAGASRVDFMRAIESHLARFPRTQKRPELERALVKAAIDAKDDKRILAYGERVLERENGDPQLLDNVARLLLAENDPAAAGRAMKYARRYEEQLNGLRNSSQPPPGHLGKAQWREELDRGVARALVLQARASANSGKREEALGIARRAYEEFPTAEGAREIGRCLDKLGRPEEAVPYLADAFTIADPRNNDAERARDRGRMGDMYRRTHGSEKGLGDLILESYDRTTALLAARRLRLQEDDPNARATAVLEFTLSGLQGGRLPLSSLKGKTVVLDFWATWCGPCRAMHPLYEEVQRRFQARPEVAFVSVNADEDRNQVAPFLEEVGWKEAVWFEDGLARWLRITSIPTTLVLDARGEIVSRMNGFSPDHFADQLTARIEETLKK